MVNSKMTFTKENYKIILVKGMILKMSKEEEKPKMTKEELAKAWKEYYEWLQSIYPVESFEIEGKDGEKLHFYHGFNTKGLYEDYYLLYCLRDKEYTQYLYKQKTLHSQGEDIPEEEKKKYKSKGFIHINKKEKWINFGIEWDYQRNSYGRALYDNIPHILDMLGIEDKEQYQLRIYGNPHHDFLKNMKTQQLLAKTNSEPNTKNALQIIEKFAKYPNTMKFSQLNTIIEYAINSNVPMRKITEAINHNGLNIFYSEINGTPHFEKEDFEKFKSFGITGLKPSCMHHHFMNRRNFGIMKLLGDVDTKDATLEFRKIFEEVKAEYKKAREEGAYISPNLKQFGEAEHIILDWECVGLLIKNINPNIKEIVKEQSIKKFEEFGIKHYHSRGMDLDRNSETTLTMLRDAGLMNKDTYIKLYQKALNRNYSLKEFDNIAKRFISSEERKLAKKEIARIKSTNTATCLSTTLPSNPVER